MTADRDDAWKWLGARTEYAEKKQSDKSRHDERESSELRG